MDLLILNARNSKEMNNISNELALKKFKTIEQDEHYILKKKKRYGNILVHAISLLIALFYFYPIIFINLAYFTYSYLWASPYVLITTDTKTETGDDLEFNTMDEVLKKANAIL
ncbi:hypothetical protein [Methanobrevibacter oralis]|uniref:Uncharacterized protein n=1 Tax=Methanobrevibacter oralis TaxID=66851 RepID=A0A166AST4_METOA|nr:hypothetical protein [Methanobrevibacter oralis]KZX12432.1 hypothetical protein MBORA_11860 [Methanobrevibacter oralis]